MKQYLIDGFSNHDYQKLKKYCDDTFGQSSLGAIYWVQIDHSLLNSIQIDHVECQPHYFALELQEQNLSCELLVRIKKHIKCDCMSYANKKQRAWILDKVDSILDTLDITV